MVMTPEEICESYKNANEKTTQLSILAQLNDCHRSEIKEILKRGGLLGGKKPARSKNVSTEKPFVVESPAVFDEQLHIRAMESYRKAVQKQKDDLEKEYQERVRFLNDELALIDKDQSRRSVIETP